MSAKSTTPPHAVVTNSSGTITINTIKAFKTYLEMQTSSQTPFKPQRSPLFAQFARFPRVTKTMKRYFSEFLCSLDKKSVVAPSVLLGVLSELLILTLVKAAGDYLEDPNAIRSWRQKKGDGKLTYTVTIVNKVKDKITGTRSLTKHENQCFSSFNQVIKPIFTSYKLNRDEYVHPEPEIELSNLPKATIFEVQASAFNTYAKAILTLVDTIKKLS